MHQQFCPRCNSTDLEDYAAGITGAIRCKKCGYMGSLIVEKTFVKEGKEE